MTGDHISTARAIAQAVEIIGPDAPKSAVMTVRTVLFCRINAHHSRSRSVTQATEFDKLTDKEIDELPELPLVIARCAPDTKGKSTVFVHSHIA